MSNIAATFTIRILRLRIYKDSAYLLSLIYIPSQQKLLEHRYLISDRTSCTVSSAYTLSQSKALGFHTIGISCKYLCHGTYFAGQSDKSSCKHTLTHNEHSAAKL